MNQTPFPIEHRRLLAGDVNVFAAAETLNVVGDNEANGIMIALEETPDDRSMVTGGTTSMVFDNSALSAANLRLVSAGSTAEPRAGFDAGFEITRNSTLRYETSNNDVIPQSELRHDGGTLDFASRLDDTVFTLGNFIIGFDPARAGVVDGDTPNTGLFVADASPGLDPGIDLLFDIAADKGDYSIDGADRSLTLEGGKLLIAPEFARRLQELALTTDDLSGADVGDVAVDGDAGVLTVDLLRVRGDSRGGVFTTINETGFEAIYDVDRVDFAADIDLNDGSDGLFLTDLDFSAVAEPGYNADIALGDGRDIFESRNSFFSGTLTLSTAGGTNTIDTFQNTLGGFDFNGGFGKDLLFFRSSSTNELGVDIDLGGGNDTLFSNESLFNGPGILRGGEGADALVALDSKFNRPVVSGFENTLDLKSEDLVETN